MRSLISGFVLSAREISVAHSTADVGFWKKTSAMPSPVGREIIWSLCWARLYVGVSRTIFTRSVMRWLCKPMDIFE